MVLKSFAVLFTFLFTLSLKASCEHNSDGMINCRASEANKFQDISKILNWWSASPEQIRNANCNHPEKITDAEMKAYIKSKDSGERTSTSLFGMNIKDEDPRLIDLLKKLTEYADPFAIALKREDEIKQNQKTFNLPSGCDKVMCALDHIFGKELGLKFLYSLDRFQMNMSEFTENNIARWKPEEVDLILESMDDLPKTLLPFEENYPLKHFKRGYGPSASTLANATIKVFSPWDKEAKEDKMMTIVHEIGHNVGHFLKLDESQEWLDFSGWTLKGEDNWSASKPEAITSEYGATNPDEDFAESTVAYRYNPDMLKKRSPEKYEFIKKYVYMGMEFDKEENCQLSKSYITQFQNKIKTPSSKEKTFEKCKGVIPQLFESNSINLSACLKEQRVYEEVKNQINQDPTLKNDERLKKLAMATSKDLRFDFQLPQNEVDEAQVKIVESLATSFKNRFSGYLPCDDQKESGWQNFMKFNKEYLSDEFATSMKGSKIQSFTYDLCLKLQPKKKASCEDISQTFAKMLPQDSQKATLNTQDDGTCSFHN